MNHPFLPLTVGQVQGTRYPHTVHDLGLLHVPSGKLEASDPFVYLGEGLVVEVPAGSHPVKVTVADVSDEKDGSHFREAYLSVILREGTVSQARYLTPVGATQKDGEQDDETYYGVSVDAGTVGFADAEAIGVSMPEENWYEDLFDNGTDDSWFSLMDSPDHLREGCANIAMPEASHGENVVLCHSGWGDGHYPLVGTFDADGALLGVHIDLQVDFPVDS